MNASKKNNRSLIMCTSPLQLLIAERIIELKSGEEFDLLVTTATDNEKLRAYFQRLGKYCTNSLYYVTSIEFSGFIDYTKQLKSHKLNKKYNNYYLASINSQNFQYILSKNKSPNIFTFDDGTANIIPTSRYYINYRPKLLKRAFWRIFGIRYYIEDIKRLSLLHYTLYEDVPNIIQNKKYIQLFSNNNQIKIEEKIKNETVRFYLGQPLDEVLETFDVSFIEKTVDKLGIDYYYPHPREELYPKGNFQLIESLLIFEDYITQYLQNHPNVNVEVFSFFSTALLNIANIERVQPTYIFNEELLKLHHNFYDFTQEAFGIPYINLDEN